MLLTVFGDSLKIHYIDEGSGDCVLLLHGWGARASVYRCIIDMLTPHCRVIAPDLPGFGESDEPSFPYDTQHYVGFVQEFLKALGVRRAAVIGHSHGGRIALMLAADKDTAFEIPQMVLMDSAGLIRKKSFSQKCKIRLFKTAKCLLSNPLSQRLFPDALEQLRKKNGSADYAAASPVMRQSMVKVIHDNLRPLLPRISCPTLLIWGELDTDTPLEHAFIMQKEIPDCGLVRIPGGSHFSFLSDPGLTSRVLHSFFHFQP